MKVKDFKINFNRDRVLIFLILFTLSICFFYMDINSTTRQGINFWKALFSGDFFQYYSINVESRNMKEMVHVANYDMIMNFVIGVWQLPLYIAEVIVGENILNFFWARVWAKLYILVATYIAGVILKKLMIQLDADEENAEYAFFMFVSGLFTINAVCSVGQVDIISVVFSLLALIYLCKDDTRKFLLFFVLAHQCKNFAIFIFLPIILLREKNLFKVVGQVGLPVIVSYLVNLPFALADPAGVINKNPRMWDMVGQLTDNKFYFVGWGIPILFILFALICIISYSLYLPEDKEKKIQWYLYIGFVSMLAFVVVIPSYPYWTIYLMPFIVIFFFEKKGNYFVNGVIETVCAAAGIGAYMIDYFWSVYSEKSLDGMLINLVLPMEEHNYFKWADIVAWVTQEKYRGAWTVICGIFIGWALWMAITYHPNYKEKVVKEEHINLRLLLWLRAGINILICAIPIILYVVGYITQ